MNFLTFHFAVFKMPEADEVGGSKPQSKKEDLKINLVDKTEPAKKEVRFIPE